VNFDEAIVAHTNWKMKLTSYISKPDHSLKASVVGSPHDCALGKWIDSEGKKYSTAPEFTALVSGHANFHKAAAAIITKADAGQKVTEEIALGAHSEYASASTAVVKSIMAMKSKL
jgi:methyl-accepting chemotaxis protein